MNGLPINLSNILSNSPVLVPSFTSMRPAAQPSIQLRPHVIPTQCIMVNNMPPSQKQFSIHPNLISAVKAEQTQQRRSQMNESTAAVIKLLTQFKTDNKASPQTVNSDVLYLQLTVKSEVHR